MSDSRSCRKQWVAPHIAGLPRSGIRDFFELVNTMDEVISLGIGEPDFVSPWHIREAAIYALNRGVTHYTSNLGDLRLRRGICDYAKERFGCEYDPTCECIVTVGVSEGLDILLRAVLSPGDEVLFPSPAYVSYGPTIQMCHAVPVPVETSERNDFVVQVSELEARLTDKTRVLLLNYPNNPTGASLTREDKLILADFVVRHDLLVVSDEIYEELSYVDRSPSIASCPGMRDRTVLLNGFSKSYAMTGFRIGYALAPSSLIEAMMKIHQYSIMCASSMVQSAALEALVNGARERDAMLEEYRQRRNVIVKRLNEIGLSCFMPRGAFYVFPCIRSSGLNSVDFATRLLREKHVAVVPGTAFGASGEGFVRCSYASSMEDIQQAMDRIGEFMEELRRSGAGM
ncbi:MAG: aminotransferase class I/II-fold pyridoxal phosphate-dependent enzyme [Lentisphaerae bacterium]|nr:aminotransferase class I/II-fold pyridoxal phosphate-dependent enzyme [Lentisphaerota bacterium]